MDLISLLKMAMQKGASDLHLKAGILPIVRIHGQLRPLSSKLPILTGEQIEQMAYSVMDQKHKEEFETYKEVDIGFGVSGVGRFRVNAFRQRGTIRMVVRNIPHQVPNFNDLELPPIVETIANYERGLVLVTGITGSGKSTTLAAMIDYINRNKNKHILTLEDPIEYLIRDRKSIITQRELGTDSSSFARSLRAALRQDPDVIFIGEMRDRETVEIALLAAETGHLVLSTLHTLDAKETINRILASFEPHQQMQIRLQLAATLKAVVSQRLAKRLDGNGFIPATEVMISTARVKEMITDPNKTDSLPSAIEEGRVTVGMQSFDQALMDLISNQKVSYEEALTLCSNPEDFAIRYSGVTRVESKKWAENSNIVHRVADEWHGLSDIEVELASDDHTDHTNIKNLKTRKKS